VRGYHPYGPDGCLVCDSRLRPAERGAAGCAPKAQLDAVEKAVTSEPVPADVAVRYLRELPKPWAKAKGGQDRAMLATALFDRIDVLGCVRLRCTSARTRFAMAWRRCCRLSSIHP
jgi:hypothetical protein